MSRADRGAAPRRPRTPSPAWSDERLVRACRRGDETAWAALIDKYKNLIYSIPLRYRASPEDAADIFQAVCLDLFSELSKLRRDRSLRSWLIAVTAHKSFHWKRRRQRSGEVEGTDVEAAPEIADPADSQAWLEGLETEQAVRESVGRLRPRCREMIRALFFEDPPRPYREVAARLGLAVGSIGFIRGRCLERLRAILEREGL